tara:strand:- start:1425 stop:2162 length:738 start_codon:yes stop_codon:yes gene_type:complete
MILKNKNILITGGGKGIGFSSITEAIKEGAYVYAIVKSKKDLQKFKKLKKIKVFLGDVTNTKLIDKVFDFSIKEKKIINGVVNNAGIRQRIKFTKIKTKEINKVFKTNFFSIFNIMQKYSNYLIKLKRPGVIVNIGSIVGQNGFSELTGYASSKSALTGLTKSFAAEMADKNIRANIINPGFIKTSYFEKFKKKKKLYNWTLSRIPLKRWGEPSEIANLINFLLSDKSSYITGENINVDGGWLSS